MEARSPGAKATFYLSFLERMAPQLAEHRASEVAALSACAHCGGKLEPAILWNEYVRFLEA